MRAPALGHSLLTGKENRSRRDLLELSASVTGKPETLPRAGGGRVGKVAGEGIMEVESLGIREWSPSKGRGRGDSRPRKQFAYRHGRTVREGIKGEA